MVSVRPAFRHVGREVVRGPASRRVAMSLCGCRLIGSVSEETSIDTCGGVALLRVGSVLTPLGILEDPQLKSSSDSSPRQFVTGDNKAVLIPCLTSN